MNTLEKAINYDINKYNLDLNIPDIIKKYKSDKEIWKFINNKIKNTCLYKFENLNFNISNRYFKAGDYGQIYTICKKNNCNFILKIQTFNDNENINVFNSIKRELKILLLLRNSNITPKLLYYFICDLSDKGKEKFQFELNLKRDTEDISKHNKVIYMIFDKWKGGSISNIKNIKDNQLLKCLKNLEELHKKNIVHYDISNNNFVYDNNEFRIIDFGLSWIFNNQKKLLYGFLIDYIHFYFMASAFIVNCNKIFEGYSFIDYSFTENDIMIKVYPKTYNRLLFLIKDLNIKNIKNSNKKLFKINIYPNMMGMINKILENIFE